MWKMSSRDRWVENLRCPQCEKSGPAELSQMDGSSDIQVDSFPEGFRVIESVHGINFYCCSCNCPAEP
jgi:hypothetical protein